MNHVIAQARAEDAALPIYFQDPDGKPLLFADAEENA